MSLLKRFLPAALALFMGLLALSDAASAQKKPRRSRTPRTAEAALAAFRKVAKKPETVRRTKLYQLGRFQSAAITKTLLRELDGAQTADYRRSVVSALGQKKRDGVLAPLTALLDDESSNFSLSYSIAQAIGAQGDPGVAVLVERLKNLPKGNRAASRLRNPILSGLGRAGTETAFDALLAIAGDGDDYEKYSVLNNLSRAPKSEKLTAFRLESARSKYEALKYAALRQLADEQHPDVQKLALEALKDIKKSPSAGYYTSQLAEVFSRVLGKATYEAFVITAGAGYQDADRLIEKVGEKIDSYEGFADWLLKKGVKRKVPSERIVSVRLLTHSKHPKVGPTLLKLVASRDPGMSLLAIRALGDRGDKSAVPILRRAMKSRDNNKKLDALLGLHALLKDVPEWKTELIGLFRGSHIGQKVLAMDLLAELKAIEILPQVHKVFGHKSWLVRAAAYDFCRLVRSLDSVAPLIERVDIEKGRLREDCLDALKTITSYRLWTTARWRAWWKDNKATFKMPTLEQAVPKKKRRSGAATVSSFFDIPLVSTRAVFVIDVSGSMSAGIGTISSGKASNTRIEEAKRQLTRVISDLPKDATFNLIAFESRVRAFAKKSKPATKKTKTAALKSVQALKASGGTNIHDALLLAFKDQGVDTIYLLSDGSPSAGKITDPNQLAAEVARWNKTRRIRIHTIAIGSKSQLMEKLAKDSGGVHSHVQ